MHCSPPVNLRPGTAIYPAGQ